MTDEQRKAIASALHGIEDNRDCAVIALGAKNLTALREYADLLETDVRDLRGIITEIELLQ